MPLVTAVCPTRSFRRNFLPDAIRYFLSQTFIDSELLIVDDDSPTIPACVCTTNPRIRYTMLPKEVQHICTGTKRNLSNEKAQGQIICHWDDDDMFGPTRIEEQVAFLKSDPAAQVIGYHDLLYIRCSDRTLWTYKYQGKPPYATGTSQMYYKSWWERHKFKTLMTGEDSEFSFEADRAGVLRSVIGAKQIVARAHNGNTYVPIFGNAPFLPGRREEFPAWFLNEVGL